MLLLAPPHPTLTTLLYPHQGKYGLLIKVTKAFESDWHAQVSLKPWTPPDTNHGFKFSFWGRAAPAKQGAPMMPKVVFQDADDR